MKAYPVIGWYLLVSLAVLVSAPPAAAGDPRARQLYGPSPHHDKGDCSLCHVAPAETLRGFFTLGSTKRQLISDPNSLCQKCHGVDFGHGVGMKPPMNRADLPLDSQGAITCALTCHNMHVSDVRDRLQLRYHLRLPPVALCRSCHDK